MTANPRQPAKAKRRPAAKRRPGPACPICRHDAHDAIDDALAAGLESRAEIGRRWGLDRSALWRHTHGGHIDARLAKHAAEAASDAAETLLSRVVSLTDRLDRRLAIRDAASNATDADIARLARELRGVLDLLARVTGRLVDRVEIADRSGRWDDADVVAVLDAVAAAVDDWPDAAAAMRNVIADALTASVDLAAAP